MAPGMLGMELRLSLSTGSEYRAFANSQMAGAHGWRWQLWSSQAAVLRTSCMPHSTQMWLCLPWPSSAPPRAGAWPSVRVITGLPLLKVPAFSFESITDSLFILLFLYFFKEPCNFLFFFPLCFCFLVPSVPLNSLKLALCLLTPN